jgi:GTP-binding nuclear protein Ran
VLELEKLNGHMNRHFTVMFDVTNRDSFMNVQRWIEKIQAYDPEVKIVIVGNKVDSDDRVVSTRSIMSLLRVSPHQYFEVSTKLTTNILDPLTHILTM